jgi:hypothetical protein
VVLVPKLRSVLVYMIRIWILRAGVFLLLFIPNLAAPLVHFVYYSVMLTVCPIGLDGGGV